jgi:hypothetical protein
MYWATFVFNTLVISFIETLYLVGVLIAVGFLLGYLEKQSNIHREAGYNRDKTVGGAVMVISKSLFM